MTTSEEMASTVDEQEDEKIKIVIVKRAAKRLREMQKETGRSDTELVALALGLYEWVLDLRTGGDGLYVREGDVGSLHKIPFEELL